MNVAAGREVSDARVSGLELVTYRYCNGNVSE